VDGYYTVVIHDITLSDTGDYNMSFVQMPMAYNFKYTYGNGDYYTGWVNASQTYGYSVGYTEEITDENGQQGSYAITGTTTGKSGSKVGEVFIEVYYDSETDRTYGPVGFDDPVGTNYLASEGDYIIQSDIPDFYFGDGYYEADVGSYSRYDFRFYYNNGSGDYYVGYVYAPTSFQSGDLQFAVGKKLYDQPLPFWSQGYKSLNDGYYYITGITDGYASIYDKQSYITSYYDADKAKVGLGVNSDGSATAANIYVADRTAAWETGYAISGANHAAFNPYSEVDVTLIAASPALASAAASPPASSASRPVPLRVAPSPPANSTSSPRSQAVWASYWSQNSSLLEEEK